MKLYNPVLCLMIMALSAQAVWSEPTPATDEIVKANNVFAIDLYAQLAKESGNLVLSPFSIDTALAMTYAGARGETARQMAGVLNLPNGDTNVYAGFKALLNELNNTNALGCPLVMAHALWAQQGYPFLEPFKNLLHDQYGSSLNQIDLTGWPQGFDSSKAAAARKLINDWVASQTHDKIKDIVPQEFPDEYTRLFLVDAIWFKGFWATPFDKALTKNALFHTDSEKTVSVPTMHVEASFNYAEDDALQVLELPYYSNQLSMVILLPKKSNGLPELEKTLTVSRIEQLNQTSYQQEVKVSLPKFKQTSQFDLINSLTTMGIRDAFDGTDADFSGITIIKPFFIEAAIHKAFVNVDEEGTEAAASTAVALANGGLSLSPVIFNADHPFFFLIRYNPMGSILFMGRVTAPLQ